MIDVETRVDFYLKKLFKRVFIQSNTVNNWALHLMAASQMCLYNGKHYKKRFKRVSENHIEVELRRTWL